MKNYPKWMLLPLLNFSFGQQFIHQMVSNETTLIQEQGREDLFIL